MELSLLWCAVLELDRFSTGYFDITSSILPIPFAIKSLAFSYFSLRIAFSSSSSRVLSSY